MPAINKQCRQRCKISFRLAYYKRPRRCMLAALFLPYFAFRSQLGISVHFARTSGKVCAKKTATREWPLGRGSGVSSLGGSWTRILIGGTFIWAICFKIFDMSNYHRPDAKFIQSLKDVANKLRIHSINSTNASNSGWARDHPGFIVDIFRSHTKKCTRCEQCAQCVHAAIKVIY